MPIGSVYVSPASEPGFGLPGALETEMFQALACAWPPLSLMTCLTTVRRGMRLLVIVQVLFSPTARLTLPLAEQAPPITGT